MLIKLDDEEIKKAIAMYVKKTYNVIIPCEKVRLDYDAVCERIESNIVIERPTPDDKMTVYRANAQSLHDTVKLCLSV